MRQAITAVLLITPNDVVDFTHHTTVAWALTLTGNRIPEWFYVAIQIDGALWYGDDLCDDGGVDDLDWIFTTPTLLQLSDGRLVLYYTSFVREPGVAYARIRRAFAVD